MRRSRVPLFSAGIGIVVVLIVAAAVFCLPYYGYAAGPSGAKALFDSGEGSSVRMSSGPRTSSPTAVAKAPTREKFAGVSYKLALQKPNGDFTIVNKSHVFRTGDRVKMIVKANRSGYLTILNVGSSGRTHVLFNDYIDGTQIYEIPRNSNFRFVGEPGTEKVLIMLSNNPNPMGGPQQQTATMAQAPAAPPPPETSTASLPPLPPPPSSGSLPPLPPPPSATADASSTLPPPPPMMLASMQSGSKDLVLEDNMKTSYAVVSPKQGWKPSMRGKDIVVESAGGTNYGVVPVSAIEEGGILTLEVKLNHR
jgi:hypothetical protein